MTPTGVAATALSSTSVQVAWADNSTNETGFEVYNGVSYTWTGIAPGTYMCFAVHAYNGDGNSPDTPYACTTTFNSKLSVAVTGNDFQVYTKTYSLGGNWGSWVPQGRPTAGIQGGLAIVYRTFGTYIMFVRGGDNALWYRVSDGSWSSIGKPNGLGLASDPDATSWGDGTASVFVTAADGRVYYTDFTGGSNPTWQGSIGSPLEMPHRVSPLSVGLTGVASTYASLCEIKMANCAPCLTTTAGNKEIGITTAGKFMQACRQK